MDQKSNKVLLVLKYFDLQIYISPSQPASFLNQGVNR